MVANVKSVKTLVTARITDVVTWELANWEVSAALNDFSIVTRYGVLLLCGYELRARRSSDKVPQLQTVWFQHVFLLNTFPLCDLARWPTQILTHMTCSCWAILSVSHLQVNHTC